MQKKDSHKKWLLQTLILSVTLNAVLMALFFFLLVRDRPGRCYFAYSPKPEVEESAVAVTPQLLEQLSSTSYEELLNQLQDGSRLLGRYRVRDWALAALALRYDFAVERALPGKPLKKRLVCDPWVIYADLSDEDFHAICTFAAKERYPYTSKGLYARLPETAPFFVCTPEFVQLETLFAPLKLAHQKQTLLTLVSEGKWETLHRFYLKQREAVDYSAASRQELLLQYVADGARTAAYLLLVTDREFVATLSDEETAALLQLMDLKTVEAVAFAKEVLTLPRKESVKKQALQRLADYSGKTAEELAGKFYQKPGVGELAPAWRARHPKALPPSTHVVQTGESLWLIARKYNVSVEKLMQANHLQSTVLQPGRLLQIPQSSGS